MSVVSAAASRGIMRIPGPLSMDALLKYGAAEGMAYKHDVLAPPPLSPKIITFDGSPPKLWMFSRTHLRPSRMSSIPGSQGCILFAAQLAQVQIAHQTEAMIRRHDHHVEVCARVSTVLVAAPPEPVAEPPPWL